jgi:hypothetical protein
MNYEVRLKIKNQTQGGRYEFMWNGQVMRTPHSTANLYIEALDDNDLINKVLDLSENTLEVLGYELGDMEEDLAVSRMVDYVTNITDPGEMIEMITRGPATISNN